MFMTHFGGKRNEFNEMCVERREACSYQKHRHLPAIVVEKMNDIDCVMIKEEMNSMRWLVLFDMRNMYIYQTKKDLRVNKHRTVIKCYTILSILHKRLKCQNTLISRLVKLVSICCDSLIFSFLDVSFSKYRNYHIL